MMYVPNSIWDIPNRIWNTVGFGTLSVRNLTMFQINIGMFGTWFGFGHTIPNPTMFQINIGMFKAWLGLTHLMSQIQLCMKCTTYVDLGHVMFCTFNVSNLTMSQINISIFGA